MSVLAWLLVALVVIGLVAVRYSRRDRRMAPDAHLYRAMVGLHRIRCRFDMAQLKNELRRDAADARRALRAELNKRDGEPDA